MFLESRYQGVGCHRRIIGVVTKIEESSTCTGIISKRSRTCGALNDSNKRRHDSNKRQDDSNEE